MQSWQMSVVKVLCKNNRRTDALRYMRETTGCSLVMALEYEKMILRSSYILEIPLRDVEHFINAWLTLKRATSHLRAMYSLRQAEQEIENERA